MIVSAFGGLNRHWTWVPLAVYLPPRSHFRPLQVLLLPLVHQHSLARPPSLADAHRRGPQTQQGSLDLAHYVSDALEFLSSELSVKCAAHGPAQRVPNAPCDVGEHPVSEGAILSVTSLPCHFPQYPDGVLGVWLLTVEIIKFLPALENAFVVEERLLQPLSPAVSCEGQIQ